MSKFYFDYPTKIFPNSKIISNETFFFINEKAIDQYRSQKRIDSTCGA